jgi:uncharacterized protein
MTSLVQPAAGTRRNAKARAAAAIRSEVGLARLSLGLIGLHVVDDNFLQPEPGVSPFDHLVSGLVPLMLVVVAGVLYGRMRPGARGAVALVFGFFGLLGGTEAAYYLQDVGLSGDDYTGLLSIAAGVVLIGVGLVTLWRSRRRDDRVVWRYLRRALLIFGAALFAGFVLFPVSIGYVVTHVAPASVPQARLGAAYEEVQFTTSDGFLLKGWYIPSRNRAAVISFPGRSGTRDQARMLARHGYGVLLFDRRGEGESEGDWNIFGWQGEHGQGGSERAPNQGFYAVAGEPKEIWEVPGAQHVGGITTLPAEYERRVIGFFDRTLGPVSPN